MGDEPKLQILRDFESVPGGWRYTVPETGVTITGKFFSELFPQVVRHMRANGLPEPSEEDIMDGACRETQPPGGRCQPVPPKPVAGALPHLTLQHADRFLRTVWQALKDRKFVSKEEAERRYAICMDCPLAGDIGGCVGCHGLLRSLAKAFSKNPPLPDNPEKRYCLACGCVISAKAMLPNATLDKAESIRPLYADHCWRLEKNRPKGGE